MCISQLYGMNLTSNPSDFETSYLAARYLFHVLNTHSENLALREFQYEVFPVYFIIALFFPEVIEWHNMEKCSQFVTPDRPESFRLYTMLTKCLEYRALKQ